MEAKDEVEEETDKEENDTEDEEKSMKGPVDKVDGKVALCKYNYLVFFRYQPRQ